MTSTRRIFHIAALLAGAANLPFAHAGDAPVFTQQPQSIMVPIGETLRLSCVVTGTPPIALIWQRDGTFLGDQTNALLTITNVQTAHSGRYRLTASNDAGLARSTNADVVVYTNHLCDFPPSWVGYYRGLTLEEAAPLSVTQLGDGQALVPDNAGNLYVLGNSYSIADHGTAVKTIKFDSTGRQVWLASYHQDAVPPYTFNNGGRAVTLDTSGNVLVAADSWCYDTNAQGQWRQVYTAIKYNADGAQLWVQQFTNSCGSTSSTTPYSVDTDERGDVYVSGNVGVVKYGSNGDFLWSSCGQYGHALVWVLKNGLGHYLTSESVESAGSISTLGVARYDTNGTTLWTTNLSFGTGTRISHVWSGASPLDQTNNIYVAVTSQEPRVPGSEDIVAVKFALDGRHLWTQRYGSANRTEYATDYAVDRSGNLIVAGTSWTSPSPPANVYDNTGFDIIVLKYAPDGTLLWSANYGDAAGSEDRAGSVATDPDGNIYVSGFTRVGPQTTPTKGVVLKCSPAGSLLWRMRRSEYPYYLATDTAGDVFATGTRVFVGRTSQGTGSYSELVAMKLGQKEPRLAVCTGLQAGWFHGSLVSPRWTQFEILGNTNLVSSDWQSIWAVTNFNGLVPFYDPQAGQHPARFYRARAVGQ